MFDIGATELMIIAIVAIVVVGPKELPRMLRTVGQFVGKARSMAREFQMHLNDAAEEAGLDEVRKGISSVENSTGMDDFSDAFKPLEDTASDIKDEIEKPIKPAGPRSHSSDETASSETPAIDETVQTGDSVTAEASPGEAVTESEQPKTAST